MALDHLNRPDPAAVSEACRVVGPHIPAADLEDRLRTLGGSSRTRSGPNAGDDEDAGEIPTRHLVGAAVDALELWLVHADGERWRLHDDEKSALVNAWTAAAGTLIVLSPLEAAVVCTASIALPRLYERRASDAEVEVPNGESN